MAARFAVGDRVAVRRAFPLGHIRTPYYARGAVGDVERICGDFGNPEELAFRAEGPPQADPLSRAFRPVCALAGLRRPGRRYHRHRALRATGLSPRRSERWRPIPTIISTIILPARRGRAAHLLSDHGDRRARAPDREGGLRRGRRARRDRGDGRPQPREGAQVVARAWTDPTFKDALLADGSKACASMGIELGPLRLIAVENTATVHNVIVCTLCSCYPRNLLGLPPDWYKAKGLSLAGGAGAPRRAERVWHRGARRRGPCACTIPPPICATLSCPRQPAGTEGWEFRAPCRARHPRLPDWRDGSEDPLTPARLRATGRRAALL